MNCKTDGAVYEIEIYENRVFCRVLIPPTANVFAIPIGELKKRIHDGMENALSPLFPQY